MYFKGKAYIRVGLLVATTDMGAQHFILGYVNDKHILIVLTSSDFFFS